MHGYVRLFRFLHHVIRILKGRGKRVTLLQVQIFLRLWSLIFAKAEKRLKIKNGQLQVSKSGKNTKIECSFIIQFKCSGNKNIWKKEV